MTLRAAVEVQRGDLRVAVDLEVGTGTVAAVLGPSGAGKTTVLHAVAGLVPLTAGRVEAAGRVLEDSAAGVRLPAERRRVGLTFQERLLFPHLTARENVAFGLRAAGTPAGEARRRADDWLGRVGLGGRGDARPAVLSGGEAQRVALARALVTDPDVLLLDEPLTGLDVRTRHEVRGVVAAHLAAFRGASVIVTHDPLDALVLADRLVIVEAGRVTQQGTPAEVSRRPRSDWVAQLVGVNLYRGSARAGVLTTEGGARLVVAGIDDGPALAVVHPHSVSLHRTRPEGTPRNVWSGRVEALDRRGDRVRVHVRGTPAVVAEVTPDAVSELELGAGGDVWATVKATEIGWEPA